MKPQWRLKLRLLFAKILIKVGKLRHADYSANELKQAVQPYLPQTFNIDVPISKGELTLLQAEVNMPKNQNIINVSLFASIIIGPVHKPIYRAHLSVLVDVVPKYDLNQKAVKIESMTAQNVTLINDEYAIVEDSRDLLALFVPKPLQNLLTDTMKSALGLMTAGGSDVASNYIKLYLSGSKKRILDYHKPQIENLVSEFGSRDDLQYQLGTDDFEEHLFCLYGKTVVVEDGHLRFKF